MDQKFIFVANGEKERSKIQRFEYAFEEVPFDKAHSPRPGIVKPRTPVVNLFHWYL